MSYCINDECPHKKRTAKPAEFLEGIVRCSECGSPLSENPPETAAIRASEQWHRPVLVTVSMVVIWHVMFLIQIPGLDLSPLQAYKNRFPLLSSFSLGSLGIQPFVSSYVLIEILALFVPPFKRWRRNGHGGRMKLRNAAFFLTLFVAPLAGLGIAMSLESVSNGQFVPHPGTGFRVIVAITLTAVVYLLVWTSDLVTRKGIGHGISILIGSRLMISFVRDFLEMVKTSIINELTTLLVLLVLVFLIALISKAERSFTGIHVKYDNGTASNIPLRLNTAGIVPFGIAMSFVMLPISYASFAEAGVYKSLASMFEPGKPGYFIASVLIVAMFYFAFSFLFYNPRRIVSYLRDRNASILVPSGMQDVDYIGRRLKLTMLAGASYLCFVALLPDILGLIPGISLSVGGISSLIMVAIALDILDEFRALKHQNNLVKVYESHDIPVAGLLRNMLNQNDIPCYLKGYHHRALLYFFGPHIEVSALVPESKVDKASEIITRYFESNPASHE